MNIIPLVDLKAQYIKIKKEIDNAIQKTLNSTSFINGKLVKDFEENLAKFCNCEYAKYFLVYTRCHMQTSSIITDYFITKTH